MLPDREGIVFVMTVDQRASRRSPDLVEGLLGRLVGAPALVRGFERTAGDEVQGVLDDAAGVVDLTLLIAREGRWSVGIGAGPVREPLPRSARAGAGAAFEHARIAVQRAKASAPHVAVAGTDPARAREAEALLRLLATLVQRRTPAGWQVVDLLSGGATQRAVAATLRITPQAVSQRVRAAGWSHEVALRPLTARLLTEAAP